MRRRDEFQGTPLVDDNPTLSSRLTDRFMARFLAAWPKRDVAAEQVQSGLGFEVAQIDGARHLLVRLDLTGSVSAYEWDGTDADAEQIADNAADREAEQAEDDRWDSGGWREWRS